MKFMKAAAAAAVAATTSLAFAQPAPHHPSGADPAPSIKLTHRYNPLDDESLPSDGVNHPPLAGVSINTRSSSMIRDQEQQYACEVISYMDGTKVLRLGHIYIELRGVGLEGDRSACATREVLRRPKTAAGDDKAEVPSGFETCPSKLSNLRTCRSDKDTCCSRPSLLFNFATKGGLP